MAKRPAPISAAHTPAPYNAMTIQAFKALVEGRASDTQQKHAVEWLIHAAARTYDQSYRADSERETVFAEGRRFVGLSVVKMVNYPAEALQRLSAEEQKRARAAAA